MVEKIGVVNQGTVENQQNIITIQEGQKALLIYSDPLPDLRYFQGRQEQLGDMTTWLKDGTTAIVGVRGEGGIGKTTLVGKVFADCLGFASKFWADVRTGTTLSAMARRALLELDVPLDQVQAMDDKDLPQRLLRHLQTGRYLLAIDNMESLLTPEGEWQGGYADFLRDFQQLGSQSVLLLASREYPPQYFGWRQSEWLLLDEGLSPEEGAALLVALEVEDDPALVSLAQRVQGNPLALTLVAGWLRQEYRPGNRRVSHLDPFDNLFQIRGDRPYETNISAEDVLTWSLDRLPEPLRHLLNQVSVFQNEFTAEMAAALVPEQPVTDADLRDLDRRSLVQELAQPSATGHLQFRLQPRIREFVQRQAGDLTTAHERAIGYFWSHRRQQFGPTDSQEAAKEHLETFYHEVQLGRFNDAAGTAIGCTKFFDLRGYYTALVDLYGQLYRQWQPNQAEKQNFAAICGNLGNAYWSLGQYQQAIDYLQQTLAIAQEIGDRQVEANSLGNLGNAYWSLGQYPQAIDYRQQQLAIAREIGDRRGEATSLGGLGNAYRSLSQYPQAIDYHQQWLAIAREIGDRRGEANSLGGLGLAYRSLSQYPQAIDYHQQWLAIAREIGDRRGEANSLGGLGLAYQSLGQYPQAIDYQQQWLAIAREIGDRQGEANSLGNLGNVYWSLGQYQQAIDYHQQSLVIEREIGNRQGEANSLGGLGNAYQSLGQYPQAIDYLQQTLAIAWEIGDRRGEANALGGLGNAYDSLGQHQQAIDYLQQTLAIAREIGDRRGEANALGNLGNAYQSLGQYQQAIDYHQQHLAIAQEIGDRQGEAHSLLNSGLVLAKLGQRQPAQENYETAKALFESMGQQHYVQQCDTALSELAQPADNTPVAEQQPGFSAELENPAIPERNPASKSHSQRVPITAWFLLGLGIAALLWWLLR
ncbi:tetratricopeptide repeat protein [Nodosilinea sp. E11]|uniref:tetratricopeptide repeat protein n=1 Tax=Nodosilinea sp. E11 TaxID=3037479 RepID=UPI00293519AE|nr:tetratricopeptide repeat protein [Nodosilinea sp. E11]WOD39073.1 tetratricopeptide repeat protein [Nodosilinea sp. E11]